VATYWEHSLNQLGYIDAYQQQTGSWFPPSEQIIRVPKDGQLRDYIAKYLSKAQARRRSVLPSENGKVTRISFWAEGEEKDGTKYEYEVRPIEGRVWGCADLLRQLRPFNVLVSDVIGKWTQYMEKVKLAHVTMKKFGTILVGSLTEHLRDWDQWTWRAFYWWHVDQFRFLYCNQTEKPPPRPESVREILLHCCSGIRSALAPTTTQPPQTITALAPQPVEIRPRSLDPILTIPF